MSVQLADAACIVLYWDRSEVMLTKMESKKHRNTYALVTIQLYSIHEWEERFQSSLRRKVLRQWLEGLTRLQIARDNQIGTGTVSEIIKETKATDSEAQIDSLEKPL